MKSTKTKLKRLETCYNNKYHTLIKSSAIVVKRRRCSEMWKIAAVAGVMHRKQMRPLYYSHSIEDRSKRHLFAPFTFDTNESFI